MHSRGITLTAALIFCAAVVGCRVREKSAVLVETDSVLPVEPDAFRLETVGPDLFASLMRAIILAEKAQNTKDLNGAIKEHRYEPLSGPLTPNVQFGPLPREPSAGACGLVSHQIAAFLVVQGWSLDRFFVVSTHSDHFRTGIFGTVDAHTVLVIKAKAANGAPQLWIVDPTFRQFPDAEKRLLASATGAAVLKAIKQYGAWPATEETLKVYGESLKYNDATINSPMPDQLESFVSKTIEGLETGRISGTYYLIQKDAEATKADLSSISDLDISRRIAAGASFFDDFAVSTHQ